LETYHKANMATKKAAAETLQDSVIDNTRAKLSTTIYFKVFLTLMVLFTLAEPIVVGFPADGSAYNLQIAILAVCSMLFVIHQIVTFATARNDPAYQDISSLELFQKLFDGEVNLELLCLVFGWATIFENRGLSALRCVRVFRLMWYFELFPNETEEDYDPNEHPFSIRRACQLCLLYLERLGTEVTTAASRGATVVLFMFFYISYLLAVVFWNEDGTLNTPEGQTCDTLNNCFIIMLRLAFYDGNGFDFLQATMNNGQHGYTFLLILYLIGSAIILLNGLIGIFGDAFSAPEVVEEEEKEHEKAREKEVAGLVDGRKGKVLPSEEDGDDAAAPPAAPSLSGKDMAALMDAMSTMNARMVSMQNQLDKFVRSGRK